MINPHSFQPRKKFWPYTVKHFMKMCMKLVGTVKVDSKFKIDKTDWNTDANYDPFIQIRRERETNLMVEIMV